MSAAGLGAPEIHAPFESSIPHGSLCHGMATARPYWDQHQDLNNLYFCLDVEAMEYNLRTHQQDSVSVGFERRISHLYPLQSSGAQRQPPKMSHPAELFLSSTYTGPSTPSPPEGDQVVPSFQRLSVYERTPSQSQRRSTKPLPPLPDLGELSSDEAADGEFFACPDDSQRLVPPAFRYGAPGRRSFGGCGRVNHACREGAAGSSPPGREATRGPREPAAPRDGQRAQERPQRRLRRSHSGPAGAFKPAGLRLSARGHGQPQDKPEVPPRAPIPPRPVEGVGCRRWSAEVPTGCGGEDKPPKVPPREPLSCCSPRCPSPKSLPIYVNGVMPPTQSFAPNPKYVSAAQRRLNSDSLPPSHTPCILPIMENGRKASTTHYFLLPHRPVYVDKFERFFREADCEAASRGYITQSGVAKPDVNPLST